MINKVCVVTGATSGIGRATALGLGESGVHLALLSRNELAARRVMAKLERRGATAEFIRVDLADFDQVRRACALIRRHYEVIDVLVNNAGARFSSYEATADGIERTFAVNHLGHFLLTALLLDRLIASPAARVITIASSAHASTLEHGWRLTEGTFERRRAYAISKLANLIFAYELARRMRGTAVTSNALDPGGVATRLGRNNGLTAWLRHLTYYALKRELRSSSDAALDVLELARSERFLGVTGAYVRRGQLVRSTELSHDESVATELWSLSLRVTGVDALIGDAWKFVEPDSARGEPRA